MSRRGLIFFGVLLLFAALYELAFRYCTASSGEADMKTQPPRVYYSDDLFTPLACRSAVFGFRTHLPLGKAQLAKGTGAYVDGGRFHHRLPAGSWQDITSTMIEYQNRKTQRDGEPLLSPRGQ